MNIVFIHTHFPGPFGFLARMSGRDEKNKTLFITSSAGKHHGTIPGVEKLVFSFTPPKQLADILQPENRPALAVTHLLTGLKKQRFMPDLIIGHSGPGNTFYVKDVFPHTPFLGFFDWFFHPDPVQENLDTAMGSDLVHRMDLRNRNLSILSDLCACDHGICPTAWQKSRFPELFHSKLSVVHPGIDTQTFRPGTDLPGKTGLPDLSGAKHLITCTADTLAPHTPCWQFMTSLSTVFRHKPGAHAVITGPEGLFDSSGSTDDKTDHSAVCEKMNLNPGQVHFMKTPERGIYIELLRASDLHVSPDSSLMVPPSLLQAMSCECLVMAPDVPPVREFITDGSNGILADFCAPDIISRKILACLDYPSFMNPLRQKARQTVVDRYAVEKTVPRCLSIIRSIVRKTECPGQFG